MGDAPAVRALGLLRGRPPALAPEQLAEPGLAPRHEPVALDVVALVGVVDHVLDEYVPELGDRYRLVGPLELPQVPYLVFGRRGGRLAPGVAVRSRADGAALVDLLRDPDELPPAVPGLALDVGVRERGVLLLGDQQLDRLRLGFPVHPSSFDGRTR